MNPTNNSVIQKAWVVNDIEQAAQDWSSAFNIGPFFLAEYTPEVFSYVEYRGAPAKLHMKTAIAYSGDLQIELVEPVGSYPCAFYDVVEEGKSGFHHICYWTDDINADLGHYITQGFVIANQGQVVGGGPRFAYIDAFEKLGCMIELLERKESTEKVFESWREDSLSWSAEYDDLIVKL